MYHQVYNSDYFVLILVEKLEGILKAKDSSLDVEFWTRTGVPELPMEAPSEDEGS